jgi:hypothetical protein
VTENRQPERSRQVFISYAHADKQIAHEIALALQRTDVRVWLDDWETAAGDSIVRRIRDGVESSDILLMLLSPSSVNSHWIHNELSWGLTRELKDRAITLIPAMVEECDIPAPLADWSILDLSEDLNVTVERFASQIGLVPELDFAKLDAQAFERMAADLLRELGFTVDAASIRGDHGFDFTAAYHTRDPFGAAQTDQWMVETKFYRKERVSVSVIRQMIGLIQLYRDKKGLIITNSNLTSVARTFLEESKFGRDLRIVDRTELTDLLMQHPDLTRAYFHRGADNE